MEGGRVAEADKYVHGGGERDRNKNSLTEYLLAVLRQHKPQPQGPRKNKESDPF